MRFTITKKIAVGFSLILLLGLVSMTIIYRGLSSVRVAMDHLAMRKEPASAAAYEMEIQIHGVSTGVLRYLDSADPRARKELVTHEAKFEQFRRQYFALADTAESRGLDRAIGLQYEELKRLGHSLMANKDQEETVLAAIAEDFEKIDKVIDEQLERRLRRETPMLFVPFRLHGKLEALLNVEAELAEVGLWLSNYHRSPRAEYRSRMFSRAKEARQNLDRLKGLAVSKEVKHWVGVVERMVDAMMERIRQVLVTDADLRERVKQFVNLTAKIDGILDNQIQVAARNELLVPTKAAEQATLAVIGQVQVLIPLFLFSAVAVGLLLVRVITAPVRALAMGTEAVARGDLSYRVRVAGRDEFADLAADFNRMVGQLEATTVSKRQLEASEQQLKDTVDRLREEIAERRRVEEEQARLQASLRRAETMAAMGSLVAGVAHEVRNPLFGISSVLDAMDARFGARDEYQQYMSVLREPVERLTSLMRELFEYGKPPSPELAAGSVGAVIEDARRACAPLAKKRGVEISSHVEAGSGPVMMDRSRLARAFENVLRNAIEHSPRGGVVTVDAREAREDSGARLECTVADSGPGIPPEDLLRIFEPFFTRRRGGTGLGLSIVQQIVEEHGGQVRAGNRPQGGAVMTLSFPGGRS